jgi:hypothetical protein
MKFKLILVCLFFLIGSFLTVNAQIEGYIKSKAKTATNRAAQNTNKEVDNQINKAVDKEFNKLKGKILDKDEKPSESNEQPSESNEESGEVSESPAEETESKSTSKSSSDDAMSRAILGKMGINMERPANMKDVYEYTGNIKMDIESWDEDGESGGVVNYTTQYTDKNNGIAMEFDDKEKGKSYMVFDYDNQLMLILADNGTDKSGFASVLGGYQSDSITVSASQDDDANTDNIENYYSAFKKTGKTKTIAGYRCDEYYFEDEEDILSHWLASDLPSDLWSKVGTTSIFSGLYMGKANGFVMESDHQLKATKERTLMTVKEVNQKQPGKISTVGYTIMTMSTPPAPKEKEDNGKVKNK